MGKKRKRRLAFSSAAAMEAHASALGGIANSHQRCSNSAIPQPKLSFVSLIAAAPPHTLSQLLFQLRCGGEEEAAAHGLSDSMISASPHGEKEAAAYGRSDSMISAMLYEKRGNRLHFSFKNI